MILRLSPQSDYWFLSLGVLGSLTACACIPVATLTSWIVSKSDDSPPDTCQNCGYDLTGNVSGRCPECGEPVGGE